MLGSLAGTSIAAPILENCPSLSEVLKALLILCLYTFATRVKVTLHSPYWRGLVTGSLMYTSQNTLCQGVYVQGELSTFLILAERSCLVVGFGRRSSVQFPEIGSLGQESQIEYRWNESPYQQAKNPSLNATL